VRKDLHPSVQAVQAGHALAEFLLNNDRKTWDNGTLVYLRVKNENHLRDWMYKLDENDVPYSSFVEPDIGDQLTAIATLGKGDIFKRLTLM